MIPCYACCGIFQSQTILTMINQTYTKGPEGLLTTSQSSSFAAYDSNLCELDIVQHDLLGATWNLQLHEAGACGRFARCPLILQSGPLAVRCGRCQCWTSLSFVCQALCRGIPVFHLNLCLGNVGGITFCWLRCNYSSFTWQLIKSRFTSDGVRNNGNIEKW